LITMPPYQLFILSYLESDFANTFRQEISLGGHSKL
jgi:hypothetical protein